MTSTAWSRRFAIILSAALVLGLVASPTIAAPPGGDGGRSPSPSIAFQPIGRYTTGLADIAGEVTAAEIVAYANDRMYVTNATDASLDVVDIGDPADPTLIRRVNLASFGSSVTSVAAHGSVVAVAVVADVKTDPGRVVFLNRHGKVLGSVRVGALPDQVVFAPDGRSLLVANEGEPNDDYSIDPEGSITIISPKSHRSRSGKKPPSWTRLAVKTIRFTDFNEGRRRHRELPSGVRIFGPDASVAQDLEPEFITVSSDSKTAWVTLQENNAVAVIDVRSARVKRIVALGSKDHSRAGQGLDPSDRDGAIAIDTWPVHGLYMPDGIANFKVGGKTYLLTANEGDAREYGDFTEVARIKDIELDPKAFPDREALQQDEALGRLNITTTMGDRDGDGDFDKLYAFGARSFTVWSSDVRKVWDSGDALEQITAAADPEWFNSDNAADAFDDRSDNKGPEPEGVTTGVIGKRTYGFIGLERVGGVMIYDLTVPTRPRFVQYTTTREFGSGEVGPDSGVEGLTFVAASKSPTGQPLLLVANEVTGTVVIYEAHDPNGASALTLLHSNDGESSLLPFETTVTGNPFAYGGVAAYASVVDREIAAARADGRSVANVYAGDAMLASATMSCSLPPNPADTPLYDALAQRQIPFDAHVIGNHEFDFGPDLLERFIRESAVNGVLTQPFLSANLDFSGEPGFADLIDPDGLRVGYTTDGRVVARSLLHVDAVTGDRFGIVAATTPALPTISSPRNVLVTSDDDATTAAVVQAEIDRLQDAWGVTKIIFVSHLQGITNDLALVPLLEGVDIAVAGGGDELLAGPDDILQPGEAQAIFGAYPLQVVDGDGRTVHVVTTPGNYRYVGRLDATFDDDGEVVSVVDATSGPIRVIPDEQPAADTLANLGITDAVVPDPAIVETVTEPVTACLAALTDPIAQTEVRINVSNPAATDLGFLNGVRNGETNGGNLVTDSYLAAYDAFAADFSLPARGGTTKVVAVQNGGGIRQNGGPILPTSAVVPGTISRLDTLNVMAFLTNIVTIVPDVGPSDLQRILERSVSAYPANQGRFLQIAGMDIVIDPSRTAQEVSNPAAGSGLQYGTITVEGERVRSVTLDDGTAIIVDGAIVAGAPNVTIVTNNFTAFQGGDNYPTFVEQPTKIVLPLTYEQALVDYILSFPIGTSGLPTIPASDTRYSDPAGEGRITTVAP